MKISKKVVFSVLMFSLLQCKTKIDANDNLTEDIQQLVKHNPTDRNYTTYFHKSYYNQLDINKIMLFFTKKNSHEQPTAIGMILNHVQKDPLEIQKYQFVIDGETINYQPQNIYTIDDFEKQKTIISCQDTLTSNSFDIVNDIINSRQSKIIYIGKNDSVIHNINKQMKTQLSQVIDAYEDMGGNLSGLSNNNPQ